MEQITRVKNCKSCPLYDDGAGNGSYQSGMDAHEPNCRNPNDPLFKKNGYHREVKNPKIIPKWCPLREASYIERDVTKVIKL